MTFLPFALSLSSTFTQIGAIAAFAALVGIAILSLLVFSQARELKRLREWAGRAPERAADLEQRVSSAAAMRVQQQPSAQMARPVPRAVPAGAALAASAPPATRVVGAPIPPVGTTAAPAGATAQAAGAPAAAPVMPVPGTPVPGQPLQPGSPAPAVGAQPGQPMPAGQPGAAASPPPGQRPLADQPPAPPRAPAPGQPPAPGQSPAPGQPAAPAAPGSPAAQTPPVGAPASAAAAAAQRQQPPGAPAPGPGDPRSSEPAAPGAPAPATAAAAAGMSPPGVVPPRAPSPPPPPPAPRVAGAGTVPGTLAGVHAPPARAAAAPRQAAPPPLEGRSIYAAKRSRGRVIAIAAAVAVVVVAAAVVAVTSLGGSKGGKPERSASTPTVRQSTTPAKHTSHKAHKPKAPTVSPAELNVAVLNATEAEGLAHRTAIALQQTGYSQASALTGKPPGSGQVSVVEYTSGHQAEAEGVASSLSISHVLPIEAAVTALASSASVVVIAGADREREASTP